MSFYYGNVSLEKDDANELKLENFLLELSNRNTECNVFLS